MRNKKNETGHTGTKIKWVLKGNIYFPDFFEKGL
jgi:hypothetical protein